MPSNLISVGQLNQMDWPMISVDNGLIPQYLIWLAWDYRLAANQEPLQLRFVRAERLALSESYTAKPVKSDRLPDSCPCPGG